MIDAIFDSGPDWLRRRAIGADAAITHADRTGRRIVKITSPERTPGVYFVSADGLVKVGRVARVERIQKRIEAIQTGCPHPLKLRLLVPGWGQSEERAIQKLFRECHHRGEWFRETGRLSEFLAAVRRNHDEAVAWLGLAICR